MSIADQQRIADEAYAKLSAMKAAEDKAESNKFIGKAFKHVRGNTFTEYFKVTAVDGSYPSGPALEIYSSGRAGERFVFYPHQAQLLGWPWEPISNAEFARAWAAAIKKVSSIT